ncbi:MAG: hypothetical protein R3F20_18395 [Planctomycetota bacterium]
MLVLAWTTLECPMAKVYRPRLIELAARYAKRGVGFALVDSAPQDSLAELRADSDLTGAPCPVVPDAAGRLAKRFGVTRSTEVLVLDAKLAVLYRGAIDDQYGYRRAEDGGVGTYRKDAPEHRHLEAALEARLAGQAVPLAATDPLGCVLSWPEPGADGPGFHETVEPILQQHCQSCHHRGGSAPFALTDYEEVKGWAGMIAEVTREGRMPPWNADPAVGHFKNARRLSPDEKAAIAAWVEGGAAKGDAANAPAPLEFPTGWGIGEPDLVLELEEFAIPAEGRLDYRYVKIPTDFTEDRWIQSYQVISTSPEVVHHVLVFSRDKRLSREERKKMRDLRPWRPPLNFLQFVKNAPAPERGEYLQRLDRVGRRAPMVREAGGLAGYFMSNLPGNGPTVLEPDQGVLLTAGATLIFQLHYTPDGKAKKTRTKVGIVFRKDPPKRAIDVTAVATVAFKLPAGASEVVVENDTTLGRDALLYAMKPHMHLRGKAFRYVAVLPDGEERHLLEVPAYDFDWQHDYVLAEPMFLPKGTVVRCRAVFDNSSANPYNPDATEDVYFGLQTEEEMMIGYLVVEWDPGNKDWAGKPSGDD